MQRRLTFTEGTSDKFWYVDVEGCDVTVKFGRRGTAGTTQTKSYPTAEKALAEAEKQVASKLKKGYADEDGASAEPLDPAPAKAVAPAAEERQTTPPAPPAAGAPAEPELDLPEDAGDIGFTPRFLERSLMSDDPLDDVADDEPLDPDVEEERFQRITRVEVRDSTWRAEHYVRFVEPVFTRIPSKERAQWWKDRLALDAPRRKYPNEPHPPNVHLDVDVATQIRAALSGIASQLKIDQYREWSEHYAVLLMRGLLHRLDPQERAELEADLPITLPAPTVSGRTIDLSCLLAWSLGIRADEVADAVAGMPNGLMNHWYTHSGSLSLAMLAPTSAERVALARRLGARVGTFEEVSLWLAATGDAGFRVIIDSMDGVNREDAERIVTTIADRLDGPGAVPLFADLLATRGAGPAAQWLRSHPAQLLAASLNDARAVAVAGFLREIDVDRLRAAQLHTTGGVERLVAQILAEADLPLLPADTDWWGAAVAAGDLPAKFKVPASLRALPPLRVGEVRLSPEQVAQVLAATATGRRDHPLLVAVREHADLRSRDRFAVAMLNGWLNGGAPAKDGWILPGSGTLGDETYVGQLAPMVREWPGQSQHKRATNGLTALRNVGTDVALQQIAGIAAKVKFRALKERAGEAMEEVAADLQLTRDQLEDRVVPDGGLDERGQRVFDYGSRQFVASVTPDAKVIVRELVDGKPSGKAKTTLPPVGKKDEAEQATAEREAFKLLKKSLTDIAKIQSKRLENAMISGRRWTFAEFDAHVAHHPVLRSLLAGIVWGVFDDAELVGTCRLDEDGALIDADDEPVDVGEHTLGVVHPLELTRQTAAAWGEVLSDFELTTPFQQLDRPLFELPADQGDDVLLHGVADAVVPVTRFLGAVSKYQWERGSVEDAGVYYGYTKYFPAAGLSAVFTVSEGFYAGSVTDSPDQAIDGVHLVRGDNAVTGWGRYLPENAVPWREAPRALVSEVLATIDSIVR